MTLLDKKYSLTINLEDSTVSTPKKMSFFNTDKNIANLYVKIQYRDEVIKYLSKEDAINYKLELTVIKPKSNNLKEIEGIITNEFEEDYAIYKFELPSEFTDQVGLVVCEFIVTNSVEKLTIKSFSYTIEASKVTGLNPEIIINPDLPILKQLIDDVKSAQQWITNIDDTKYSEVKTYSSKKIEDIKTNIGAQLDIMVTPYNDEYVSVNYPNIQVEVNNLVTTIAKHDEQFNTKANQVDLETQIKRIDSFTSLPQGSTTGDAELIDARVGADGVRYNNLGTAIRTQFANVKTGVETLSSVSNIITIDKFSDELVEGLGKYIDKYNLVLGTNAYKGACTINSNKLTSFTSEYSNNRWAILNVTPGQRLKISLRSHDTSNYHIILADKDNNVIAKYINDADLGYTDYELIIPKGVTKLGVNSYSYLPTVLSYSTYSPLANKDYIDIKASGLSNEVKSVKESIGENPIISNLIDIVTNQKNGAVRGKIGETLRIESQEYYQNTWLSCSEGDTFEVTLLRSGVENAEDGYIHFVDNNLKVISVDLGWTTENGSVTKEITVPTGATKLYICSYTNSSYFLVNTKCKKIKKVAINEILNNTYYKTNIEFISRQGQINNYPENSLYGVKSAYENGYDNIRVSVTMTGDHIPVLCHDETINRLARNADGTTIADTLYLKDLTLEQINKYDWGRVSGKPEIYGINITTLEEFIKFAKYRGIKIRLELKYTFTDDDVNSIILLLTKWGMLQYATICASTSVLDKFYEKCKCCDYALVGNINNTAIISNILKYKNSNNNVWLDMFGENYDITTPELLLQYKTNNILIKVGSAYNGSDIKKWFEAGVDAIEVAYYGNPHKYIYNQY